MTIKLIEITSGSADHRPTYLCDLQICILEIGFLVTHDRTDAQVFDDPATFEWVKKYGTGNFRKLDLALLGTNSKGFLS